jgi:glycosyltransferase involved in cell wall biosynthesis
MADVLNAQHPLVSILIPCHNAQRWLRQCLDSALGQTYTNIEVIVVDDGSTDQSPQILREYAGRIEFEARPHGGGNAARNRLLQLARGQWLQYLDADDYLLPGKISRQMAYVAANPCVDVVYSPLTLLKEPSGETERFPVEHKTDFVANFLAWNFTTGSLLFRRGALESAGRWNESQVCCQDAELLLRLILQKSRFGLVEGYDMIYRQHGNDTVSKRDPERTIQERMKLTDQLEKHLVDSKQLSDKQKAALARARFESARSLYVWDPRGSRKLMTRAWAEGPVPPTPAGSASYRWTLKWFGLDAAEITAAWSRSLRTRFRR